MAAYDALNQRIVIRYHATGLARTELGPYLAHLLRLGGTELPLVEPAAEEAMFQATSGLPRKVNLLAHHALMAAVLAKAKAVSADQRAGSPQRGGVMPLQNAPFMQATATELAFAPEVGVLVALDAVIAVAAFQLAAENPDISLDSLARGDPPSAQARKACSIIFRIGNLRAAMRHYRDLSLSGQQTDFLF